MLKVVDSYTAARAEYLNYGGTEVPCMLRYAVCRMPFLCCLQLTPGAQRAKRRCYSPSALVNAYQAVKEKGVPVFRAAREYSVPLTTLRDRVDNRVSIDCTKPGPEPVLSQLEEAKLVSHIKELAAVCYGYTRAEVLNMASDYAVSLGKREKTDKPFSMQWFYSFMNRWPELHVVKPSSLSEQRARCASEETISNYFAELEKILIKYDLKDKPHLIYNIDEKGINTEFRPPNVVAGKYYQPQMVMSERSKTVTVIGAGNALGSAIPPYFIFPGQRMVPDLLKGKTVGADGTVTQSGWSNSDIFRMYMKDHFSKYVQGRDGDTLLVLYDGHRSHISLDLIEWARDNNMVLFVLPPHCSHILQPMDIGCFGPLQLIHNQECLKFSRSNHRTVTRYDVCNLACKAYSSALSPSNLQGSFSKAGIYPFMKASEIIDGLGDKIAPSKLYCKSKAIEQQTEELPDRSDAENENGTSSCNETLCNNFFMTVGGKVSEMVEGAKQKRRNISSVAGGKAVTEDQTITRMKEYIEKSRPSKNPAPKFPKKNKKMSKNEKSKVPKTSTKSKGKLSKKSVSNKNQVSSSPQPGPSHINLLSSDDSSDCTDNESESQIAEKEKCCVCKRFYVRSVNAYKVSLTNWAECDVCGHWVHLAYCTTVRVVRKETPFKCPCC